MAELKGVAGLPRICTPTTDLVRRTTQNDTCSQRRRRNVSADGPHAQTCRSAGIAFHETMLVWE